MLAHPGIRSLDGVGGIYFRQLESTKCAVVVGGVPILTDIYRENKSISGCQGEENAVHTRACVSPGESWKTSHSPSHSIVSTILLHCGSHFDTIVLVH